MTATAPPAVRPADNADTVKLYLGLTWEKLTYAYVRWRAEDLFPLIFYRQPDMTLGEFLDWNYRPTVEPVGCWMGEHLIGIGWICQAYKFDTGVVAEVGAAFFKGTPAWAWHSSLDKFLTHAFEDRGFVEIFGLSAEKNPYAKALLRHCGMEPVRGFPWREDVPADMQVYKLDRRAWEVRKRLN